MRIDGALGPRATVAIAVAGIMLISLNLRAAVTGWPPLVDLISADIALSTSTVGVLGMIAPVAFAIAGLTTPWVSDRLPLDRALVGAVLAIILGHLLRAFAPNLTVLMAGSIVGLLGVGFGNVLLPAAVKRYAPHAIGRVTAAYVTMLALGTAAPAMLAVPVANLGSWRWSFVMWAILAVLALMPWVTLAVDGGRSGRKNARAGAVQASHHSRRLLGPRLRDLRRSRTVLGLTVLFIASSFPLYGLFALLPIILKEIAGTSAEVSGALVALLAILSLPQALVIPIVTSRLRSPTWLIIISVTFFSTGVVGLILWPQTGLVFWIVAIGAGQFLFPITLTLFSLRTLTSETATRVSGFVQGVGYGVAALAPPSLALLREWTGSWTPVLLALMASSLLALASVPVLRARGIVEHELRASGGEEP